MEEKKKTRRKTRAKTKPEPAEKLTNVESGQQTLLTKTLVCLLPLDRASRLAARLLDVFGSVSNVLSTSKEELMRLPEMDEQVAHLLGLVGELAKESLEDRASGVRRIFDTHSAVEILRPKFLGRAHEAVALLLIDARGGVVFNDIVTEGSVSDVPVYIRRLVGLVIQYDAVTAVMAHNHPSGSPLPSRNDVVATRQVEIALQSIDAVLMDHIIFADNAYFAFSSNQEWRDAQGRMYEFYRTQLDKARQLESSLRRKANKS